MKLVWVITLFASLCQDASKATECTGRGRFPNDDVQDCRGYTMCLLGGANGFTQYKLTCPVGFIYSHLEQQCTNATNYRCMYNFQCSMTGNFENPLISNCSSYVACPQGLNGIVSARQVECPLDQIFNPLEAACVNNIQYECITGEESMTTMVSLTEVPPESHSITELNIKNVGEEEYHVNTVIANNAVVIDKHFLMFTAMLYIILIKV